MYVPWPPRPRPAPWFALAAHGQPLQHCCCPGLLCAAGDPSEDFKFASFFPDFMEGPVDAVAGVLGVVFQLRHSAEAVAHHKTNVLPVTQPILGADSADAARRRWVVGRQAAAVCLGCSSGASK